MAKQLTEEELNLRRKLRRRLIGAAALMLAVVVFLPMVLDNEPKSTGEDIDMRIPAADKVGEFVPGKAAEEIVDVAPLTASAVTEAPEVGDVAASAVVPAMPITRAIVASSAVEKAPTKEVPKDTTKPVVKPISKPVTSMSAAPKPVVAPPEAGFVAQVGAYGNADTAQSELAKLKAWGFKAYTEKAGNTLRVRVGPYAERDKAETVARMLEKHGLHPVVTPLK